MTKCEIDEMLLQRRDAIFRKLTFEGKKISSQAIICLIKNQTDFKAKKKFLRAPISKRFVYSGKSKFITGSSDGFDFRPLRQESPSVHLVQKHLGN